MEQTQTKPKRVHLKPKEKEFAIKFVKNNENLTKTAQEVFKIEDPNYAHVKATRMIQKDIVVKEIEIQRETLKSALEKKGITPEKIADKINVLLDAEDLETGKKDYTAIDKGLKHAKEIYGIESEDDKRKVNTTYNFIFSKEIQEQIRISNEIIKAKLISNDSET